MSISTRKTSASHLALSGILLLHLLTFYPDCTKGEQIDAGSAQGFRAALEQGGDYKLPQDWFSKHISDRQKPAELELPLKELWRFGGFPKIMPFFLGVEVYDGSIFVSYRIPDPNSDPNSARTEIESIVACKELKTGQTVWSVTGIGGRLACIPGHLLVHSMDSILVLQTESSRTVCEFPLDPLEIIDRHSSEIIRLRQSLNPMETDALHERNTTLKAVFSTKVPASPVPIDVTKWTVSDACLLFDILTNRYLPRCGAVQTMVLFPNREDVLTLGIRHILTYKSVLENRIHWQQIVSAGNRWKLLWQPPYVILFSHPNAITAYSIRDGRACWMYEYPAGIDYGARVQLFAALTDGILLLTDPLTRKTEEPKNRNIWLTKLDRTGKRLFKQELPVRYDYPNFMISSGHFLLLSDEFIVCYGYSSDTAAKIPQKVETAEDENQRTDEIERLHKKYEELGSFTYDRRFVCEKLGMLQDRSMLEQVLKDFDKAAPGQRTDYVDMMGLLRDRRAIPVLISQLRNNDFGIRHHAQISLQLLTGLTIGDLATAEEWERWWEQHKHLYE